MKSKIDLASWQCKDRNLLVKVKVHYSIRFGISLSTGTYQFSLCSCEISLYAFRLGQINNEYFYVLLCVNLKGGLLVCVS